MRHSHIDFRPVPRVTTFEQALPLADHALDFPPGTLIAMILGSAGDVTDTLVFDDGERCPIDIVESVCAHALPDDCALVVATNRRDCDPRERELDDVATWEEMWTAADAHGIELREWFVLVGDLLWVPRELSDVGAEW